MKNNKQQNKKIINFYFSKDHNIYKLKDNKLNILRRLECIKF